MVPVQMWQEEGQSRCRCGWQEAARSRRRCGRGAPGDVALLPALLRRGSIGPAAVSAVVLYAAAAVAAERVHRSTRMNTATNTDTDTDTHRHAQTHTHTHTRARARAHWRTKKHGRTDRRSEKQTDRPPRQARETTRHQTRTRAPRIAFIGLNPLSSLSSCHCASWYRSHHLNAPTASPAGPARDAQCRKP